MLRSDQGFRRTPEDNPSFLAKSILVLQIEKDHSTQTLLQLFTLFLFCFHNLKNITLFPTALFTI